MSRPTEVGYPKTNSPPKPWEDLRPMQIEAYNSWNITADEHKRLCRCFDPRKAKGERQCPSCTHYPGGAAKLRSCWATTKVGWERCSKCTEFWKEEYPTRADEESPSSTLAELHGSTYDAAHPGAPEAVMQLEEYAKRLEENAKRIEAHVAAFKSEGGNAEEIKEQVAALQIEGGCQADRIWSLEETLKRIELRLGWLESKVSDLEWYANK